MPLDALQSRPESGALWEKFVNSVIARHGFASTTHEHSLYQGVYKGHRMLICCQVDDLAIGCVNTNAVKDLVRVICAEDGIDLRDEGVLNSFNSVDVEQCDQYIKITCESDIDYAHYGWSSSGLRDTDEKPIEPVAASMTQQMFDDYSTAPRDGSTEYCDLETAAVFHTEVSWVRYFTPMLSLGRTSDMRSRHLHASPTIQQRCTTTPYAVSHCTYE